MLLYEVTCISVKMSSFEVEFKEKLYKKYSKCQKYHIPKEEYYKILEDLKPLPKSQVRNHITSSPVLHS